MLFTARIIFTVIVALSGFAAIASAASDMPQEYDILVQRNIFSSTRTKVVEEGQEAPRPKPEKYDPLKNWVIRGCMTDDQGLAVMLENIASPGDVKLFRKGDELLDCSFDDLTMDGVTISTPQGDKRVVALGESLAGGKVKAVMSSEAEKSDQSGAEAGDASSDTESVLERLRRKRRQERGG